MALTDRQKRIIGDAWRNGNLSWPHNVYGAVEAILAEQASAAEQGQYDHECNSTCASDGCVCECHYPAPAQPPAEDVQMVERMLNAYMRGWQNCHTADDMRRRMTAALAVAQQERDAQWAAWGIIEVAVRNQSVAEYMKHWEGRATKAEAAQQVMVSLADVEDIISTVIIPDPARELLIKRFRARLAKPSERVTDEQPRYKETLRLCIDPLVCSICGADVLNTQKHSEWHALRDGKEAK